MTDKIQNAQPEQLHKNSDHVHALPGDRPSHQPAHPSGVPPEHRLLTTAEAAAYFQVTERTVEAWRAKRLLPYRKIGRTIRYRFGDLLQALDERFLVSKQEA